MKAPHSPGEVVSRRAQLLRTLPRSSWVSLVALCLPILAFYAVLIATLSPYPCEDDYSIVLNFLSVLQTRQGALHKLAWILSFQHNNYKLVFVTGVLAVYHAAAGPISFVFLGLLADSVVLLIFVALVLIVRRADRPLSAQLLYLLPATYLFFQLQYCANLNWAGPGLQNLSVVFFALLSCFLLAGRSRGRFVMATAAMVLAVAASANGFVVAVLGLPLLLWRRAFARAAFWSLAAAAMAAVYAWRYHPMTVAATAGGPTQPRSLPRLLIYVLSFLGGTFGVGEHYLISAAFGLGLVAVLLYAAGCRYHQRRPALALAALFVLGTACLVALGRAQLGTAQSLALRYRMYSNLLVIFCYCFFADELQDREVRRDRDARSLTAALFAAALLASVLFCAASDVIGARFLVRRKAALAVEMRLWLADESENTRFADSPNLFLRGRIEKPVGFVLERSIALGIYRPPALPPSAPLRSAR